MNRAVMGCCVVVSLVVAKRSAATVVDFDGVTAPCGFSDTMAVRNEFVGSGVAFSAPGNDGATVLHQCGVFAVTGHSPPNFLAFSADGFYLNGGIPRAPETLLFSPAVASVCFRAGSGFDPGFTLSAEAFDGADNPLESSSLVLAPALAPISVTSPGIAKVVVTLDGPKGHFVIDDLAVLDSQDVRATVDAIFDLARARCNSDCNHDENVSVADVSCVALLLGH